MGWMLCGILKNQFVFIWSKIKDSMYFSFFIALFWDVNHNQHTVTYHLH